MSLDFKVTYSRKKKIPLIFTAFMFVLWAVFMTINKSKEIETEAYNGETLDVVGKVVAAQYAGQNDFFGKYNNYITLESGLNFHLSSKNIEMFCKGDVLKITYPKSYNQESRYTPAVSYQVKSKGACGQIKVEKLGS